MASKTAMITIVGRPNVGKSTLTNRLVGEKVAIVSHKPQTTRNRICGIVNRADTQFIFVDTPGFHKPRTKLGDYMVNVTRQSVSDVDAVILMVEPIAHVGRQEEALLNQLRQAGEPVILAINKIDTVEKDALLSVIARYHKELEFAAVVPICAKSGDGIEELLAECSRFAQEGPHLFPEDATSDQPERQMMAEIIREKLLRLLDKEVPHGVAVSIEKMKERENGIIDIDATIFCERDTHKGIIIGKQGSMLKKIGSTARYEIERLLGCKVNLKLWVKVQKNWRDSDFMISNFGYHKN